MRGEEELVREMLKLTLKDFRHKKINKDKTAKILELCSFFLTAERLSTETITNLLNNLEKSAQIIIL